jgi:gamma-glutamyltranspeptidase/glutathione hydrolase
MVVSHNHEAAEAGIAILAKGGNAFDAAIAMSFVTAVREVAMNGIGGVGVLLAHSADTGDTTEINFYGQTPEGLAEDTFVPYLAEPKSPGAQSSFRFRRVQDARNERGYLSVGVPTLVAGLAKLHELSGTLPWEDLIRPAVQLAEEGYAPDDEDTFFFATHLKHLKNFPEIHDIFLADGIPMPGDFYQGPSAPVRQADLAKTLFGIASDGVESFYHGPVAQTIVDHVRANGGVLSTNDFATVRPEVGGGLRGTYKGYEVITASGMTGGVTLMEMLNLAEALDLGSMERWSGHCLHLIAEVMRQAWTDRFLYVGDPSGATVPLDGLTDKRYARTLLDGFPTEHAPARGRPGDPWPFSSLERPGDQRLAGDPGGRDTTHLAAADGDGNVVTLTQTLGMAFGSCVVAPTTGVNLYDVTVWMNPVPGTPNSVGPAKKQAGHATPVILCKDGKPVVALGAPGGRRVVTAMFQTILNIVDFGMDVQEAIGAPRIHCEGADPADPAGPTEGDVLADDRINAGTLGDLLGRGHRVRTVHETGNQAYLARPLGIQLSNGELFGGVDVFRRSLGIGL